MDSAIHIPADIADVYVGGVQVWPTARPSVTALSSAFIAHRGGIPENTAGAFDAAAAAGYAIEADVVQLADGSFAVTHDLTLDRVTAASGSVSALTRAEWLALRCDIDGGGMLLTLDQLLDRFGPGAHYVLDIKAGEPEDLAGLLDLYGWAPGRVIVAGTDALCRAVRSHGYTTGLVAHSAPTGELAEWVDWLLISKTAASPAWVAAAVDDGAKVAVWTVNDRAESDAYAAAGAYIITDLPDRMSGSGDPEEGRRPVRLRYNGLTGTLGAAHNDSTTTLTLTSKLTYVGGDVPTISGDDYLLLSILDSDGNCAEVVKVTAYTSAATTATIERGQEDTSGVAHDSGATFVHGPTAGGFSGLEHIASGSLSGTSTTISLPSGYYGFRLVLEAQSDDSTGSSEIIALRVTVGGTPQTGSNYAYAAGAFSGTSLKSSTATYAPTINCSRGGSSDFGIGTIEIAEGYDSGSEYTRWTAWGGHADTEGQWTAWGTGAYLSAAAVDGVQIAPYDNGFASDSWVSGSRYRLYGYTA